MPSEPDQSTTNLEYRQLTPAEVEPAAIIKER